MSAEGGGQKGGHGRELRGEGTEKRRDKSRLEAAKRTKGKRRERKRREGGKRTDKGKREEARERRQVGRHVAR